MTRTLRDSASEILRWFYQHANSGYVCREVSGWAHLDDVRAALRVPLPEILPALSHHGYLDREDVRGPHIARPVWVYRISPAGVRMLTQSGVRRLRGYAPPGPPEGVQPVYIPDRPRGVLSILREAFIDPLVPLRWEMQGWVTGRELGQRASRANETLLGPPFYCVDNTDLRWLLRSQFAELRRLEVHGRAQPMLYYRVTASGRTCRVLEWSALAARGALPPRPENQPMAQSR